MGKPKSSIADDGSKKIFGKKVRYVSAHSSVFFTCPQCNSKKRFAMLSEYSSELYCSELCVIDSMRGDKSDG